MMSKKFSRRSVLGGALGAPGALLFAGSAWSVEGRTLSVGIDRDVKNLDPPYRAGQVDGNIIRVIFQRLISFKPGSFTWEPDAVSKIEQVSPTEIAFTLKPGQMFTDGYGEMTADDVKFSYERYLAPSVGGKVSSYKSDWETLVEVRVHDRYSASLILSRPTPAIWMVALVGGSGVIQSRKAVEALGEKHSQGPVGSGPYRLSRFDPQRGVTLEANPAFQGPKPDFDVCNVRYIQNPKTVELALRAGELDFSELSLSQANALQPDKGLVIAKQPSLRFVWLGMNTQRAPLDNLLVREAIRAALDVDQMVTAGYDGNARRLDCLIPPGLDGHWKDAPHYSQDIERARALLVQSGIALPLTLKLTILNEPAYQNMALMVQAFLQPLGINVEVDQRESGTFWSAGKGEAGKTLELFINRFNAHLDPNNNTRWFMPDQIGDWNWQRFNDPEYERLQNLSRENDDPASRVAQIIEMQKLLDKSASVIWLTNDVFVAGYRAGITPMIMPNGNDWQLNYFTKT